MLKMRHFPRKIPDCDLWTRTLTSSEYEVCTCPSRADMPRTAGRMGFSGLRSRKFRCEGPKPGTWKNGKIYLCWRAPPHFVRFSGAPGFRQKRVFENRQIFAETTENVVPNGRGSKTHFCTVGFEIGHLRSGSNIVPIYSASIGTSFPTHLQEDKVNCFIFLPFPFLSTGPFLYFSWLHFVLQ